MPTRAAIYCRISDDREGAGLGVARQEADCRALADSLGAEVVAVYQDNDMTASDRRKPRPDYQRLLAAVRNRDVALVLAWHTDRLHRHPVELEEWIDACDGSGVTVQTVRAGRLDLATAAGRMIARQLGNAAKYESEVKRERNLRKALELAEAGKLGNGGPRPFGYDDDRITVRPHEAELLRQAYLDVLAGKGLSTIAREWREKGVRSSGGRLWSGQALRFTLLRGRNVGWREHHGKLVAPAVWEPIIDRETWEQVKAKLTSPDRPNAGRAMYARRYLLSGFLSCGVCGGRLKPNRNADLPRFACRPGPGQPSCGRIAIRYGPTEEYVVDLLLARIERDVDLTPEPDDPTEPLRQRIAELETRLRNLAAVYADSGDFLEMRSIGDKYRGEIADLRRQIGTSIVRQQVQTEGIRERWATMGLDERRAVVGVLIDRVVIAPARPGNTWQADRLTVMWR